LKSRVNGRINYGSRPESRTAWKITFGSKQNGNSRKNKYAASSESPAIFSNKLSCRAAWVRFDPVVDSSRQSAKLVEFHLLKGPEAEDHTLFASRTVWENRAVFEAWTKSEAFRAAHSRAGANKPLYLDHPQFEGV
jgi:quinol monooxygenase YgiN